MSNKDKILAFLRNRKNERYCDDCLSGMLKIYPRQQVNQICRNLSEYGQINRKKGLCSNCLKYKIVNSCGKSNVILSNELLIPHKIFTQKFAKEKRLYHKEFEDRVFIYLYNKFKQKFYTQSLQIGPNKYHGFDLVSEDRNIVVECKSYTWTGSDNFPSAKISTAVEATFYLTRIRTKKKILVFQDDFNSTGESLADTFVRRYNGVLDDIEVWAYNAGKSPEKDYIRIVRTPKDNW